MNDLVAPIQIPWCPEGNLGKLYLDTVRILAPHFKWVPFMDHDCEILTRNWYNRLVRTINTCNDAGIITCRINMQHGGQRTQSLQIKQDLNSAGRTDLAKQRATDFKDRVTKIGVNPQELISGAWFCVHAERFLEACSTELPSGFYGIDNWIHYLMHQAGWPTYVIEDMVVWHRYTHLEKRENRSSLVRAGNPIKAHLPTNAKTTDVRRSRNLIRSKYRRIK